MLEHRLAGALAPAFGIGVALASLLALSAPAAAGTTTALLLNGGDGPSSNYLSHLHHLQEMFQVLARRGVSADRIHVFCSDGDDPEPDLSAREVADPRFWLLADTAAGTALRRTEQLDTSSAWPAVTLHPARIGELRRWFATSGRSLGPGDTLFVFVTDHGKKNADDPENGFLMLWKERLSVLELRALLAHLDPAVRVVMVMSQCYSGAFAAAMAPFASDHPAGNVCGFFSTTADRKALGCYPEGRGKDRTGHAFRFIDALAHHPSGDGAHREVLVSDATPDVPVRTSDLYLEGLLAARARRRSLRLDALADQLLASAWAEADRFRPELELVEQLALVYYDKVPQTLAELDSDLADLRDMSAELDSFADRWKLALDTLRADNLSSFLVAQPSWQPRLEAGAIAKLEPAGRQKLLDQLLPEIERDSRRRADVWVRLTRLDGLRAEAERGRFRADTRVAALERMRRVLLRVAGTYWLEREGDPAALAALGALVACETSPLGDTQAVVESWPATEALPAFASEREALERVLPSWLGIEFGSLAEEQRRARGLLAGAAEVKRVMPDSAADCAGLRPGDIVIGPPGEPFRLQGEIREWTMASPRDVPLPLEVLRDGQPIEVTVLLGPYRRRG